jgi:ABC-2 type transport system permease protein
MRTTLSTLAALCRRRLALSARTPRELIVPLLTPVLFAVVIAPALARAVGSFRSDVDYMTYVALATAGLLIPLNTMFAGIGVLVDRDQGAQRELLAAPIARALIVVGNLTVAATLTGLQLVTLIAAAVLRGADFHTSATRVGWFVLAALGLTVAIYGIAETLAHRIGRQEEYVGMIPTVAIVPWFFAGSLFPLGALPAGLAGFAKALPLTHALAVLRYGLVDTRGHALHDIWGLDNTPQMAAFSVAVVGVFALATTWFALWTFRHATAGH